MLFLPVAETIMNRLKHIERFCIGLFIRSITTTCCECYSDLDTCCTSCLFSRCRSAKYDQISKADFLRQACLNRFDFAKHFLQTLRLITHPIFLRC